MAPMDPSAPAFSLRETRKTLIARVMDECETSWREFQELYWGFVCSIASGAGVRRADVEDVAQQIFIEICRDFRESKPDFGERSFGAWLARKVKWRVIEYHRHRHRRETPSEDDQLDPDACSMPFDEIWDREWRQRLVEMAMGRIHETPRNLLIFQSLALRETPVEEVCREFGISRSNADTIKNRVKTKVTEAIRRIEQGEM